MDVVADFRCAAGPSWPPRPRARPHRGPGDPHRDRQRHRHRGDLRAPGDRLRARRATRCSRSRRAATRANVIAALAEARRRGLRDDRAGRLRRRPDRRRAARRPRGRHPLGAHPAHPGGAGQRLPRAARAGGARRDGPPRLTRRARRARASRARCRASASGPFVYRLAARARARRASCSTTRAACVLEVEGDAGGGRALPRAARRRGAAAGRVERVAAEDACRPRASAASRSARARAAASRGAAGHARHARPAPTACASCSTRRPPLPLPVHQLHQLRPAVHDRARRPLRPAAARRWPASRCARPAGPSTRTRRDRRFHAQPNACPDCGPRAAAASAPTAEAAGDPSRPRPRRCATGAIVAVKGIGGFHLACRADDEAAVARAARAQAPRGQAVRADGADLEAARALVELGAGRGGAARSRRSGRSCSRRGGRTRRVAPAVAPALARARRDAALLAAAPPAARRRRARRS